MTDKENQETNLIANLAVLVAQLTREVTSIGGAVNALNQRLVAVEGYLKECSAAKQAQELLNKNSCCATEQAAAQTAGV